MLIEQAVKNNGKERVTHFKRQFRYLHNYYTPPRSLQNTSNNILTEVLHDNEFYSIQTRAHKQHQKVDNIQMWLYPRAELETATELPRQEEGIILRNQFRDSVHSIPRQSEQCFISSQY